jgi:hypothetical protein
MYGALDFAEQLDLRGSVREKRIEPALGIRALKFNIPLPGTGYLSEEDLANNQWFWSLDYWRKFVDMAARNRYNALTFWSAHPFDRMVRIPKYPEATDIPPAELDRNIAFFRKLFQMAADRGLDTYLVTWNIHVSRAFAAGHNIPVSGFDSPLVRDYQREAIKALFATYPTLTGMGTTAGERMPNKMTAREKLDWVAETYFAALRQVGKPVPFILRYWQSEPEAMAAMLDAVKYPAPVYLDIKYNGEHMYSSTRPHVLDRRWIDLAHGRYQLLWHLRNDCLFILRWGDPDFARDVVRHMAGPDTAGFVEGSELDVPGSDRIHTPAAQVHLDWEYKFEKHWFRYMLWGRLGYFADEPDETWRDHFTRRFGAAGPDTFEAMRQAGRIVPLITSYHWNYMNGDWYPEGSVGSWNTSYEQSRVNYRRAALYHDIRTYIFNNTIDPEYANIPEYLAASKATGPLDVAGRLASYGRAALRSIAAARGKVERGRKEFACTEMDLQAYGNLGIYYAEKLRGAAHLARFLFSGDAREQRQAVDRLQGAAAAWRAVVAATEHHYIPHEVWLFGQFDWKRYLPDVERDIEIAREIQAFHPGSTYDLEGMHPWLEYCYGLLGRPIVNEAAQAVHIEVKEPESVTAPESNVASPAGNSITGVRDYVSAANSATYRFQIPVDGAYQISASASWPGKPGTVVALVDENNIRMHYLRPGGSAAKVDGIFELGAGTHTVRFFSRSPGARIGPIVVESAR